MKDEKEKTCTKFLHLKCDIEATDFISWYEWSVAAEVVLWNWLSVWPNYKNESLQHKLQLYPHSQV